MASITFHHLATGVLKPGETHTWTWNNAPTERVWAFSVDAYVPISVKLLGPPKIAQVEITRVEYRQDYTATNMQHRVRRAVKNVGTVDAEYYFHMAIISE